MQSAAVLGIYGLVAPSVFVFSILALVVPGESDRLSNRIGFCCAALLVAGHLAYGGFRVYSEQPANEPGSTARLVQPLIPQSEKFEAGKHGAHLRRYLDLSSGGIDGKTGLADTSLLFWPESVFPYLLTENKQTLAMISSMLPKGTFLVTGAARAEPGAGRDGGPLVFNSIYVVNDEGLIVSAADKVHLVPFGEYLPFQNFLESLGIEQLTQVEGGFESGGSRQLLTAGTNGTFLPLICYEIIFSGDIWNGQERPAFIANLTNDAWFGNTPGPYQHEHQSVVRAVEQGHSLVRVSNSGISGIYNAFGQAQVRSKLNEIAVLDGTIPLSGEATLFSIYGWKIFSAIVLSFFVLGAYPIGRRSS